MTTLADGVRFFATSIGTVDFVDASAVQGYRRGSGVLIDGKTYRYRAENASLTEFERGYGVWTAASNTLARTTIEWSSTGSKVSFGTIPQVAITPGPSDIQRQSEPQGRLTLQTLVPVMVTTQSGKTTLYYTPYVGNQVPLYDGVDMVMTDFAELSIATTDTTKNPAAIGVSKVNDWFVWNDAGTIRLSHGPDWTSDTARSAGTALVMVNGVLLNNAAITNGPGASRGTYVGTTRSDVSSQLNWILGTVAAGGGAASLMVWNAYCRRRVGVMVNDNTDSWTYATAAWRAANNSATIRVNYIMGLSEDGVVADYIGFGAQAGAVNAMIGVGVDSTVAFSGIVGGVLSNLTGAAGMHGHYRGYPGIGVHFLSAIEYASGATATYYGDAGVAYFQSGLSVEIFM